MIKSKMKPAIKSLTTPPPKSVLMKSRRTHVLSLLLSLILSYLLPQPAHAVFYYVQGKANFAGPAATVSVTLGSNPGTGHLVACSALYSSGVSGSTTISSALDGNNNNYTVTSHSPSTSSNSSGQAFLLYLLSAPTNANKTITVTFANSGTLTLWCDEFAVNGTGTSVAFDTDAALAGTGSTTITGPTIAPAASGELMYSACSDSGAISAVNGPWSPSQGGIVGGDSNAYNLNVSSTLGASFTTASSSDSWS